LRCQAIPAWGRPRGVRGFPVDSADVPKHPHSQFAGSPSIPESLKSQLVIGGKLVIPVGDKFSQTLKVLTKLSENEFEIENIPEFAFVPLIGREGWKNG